MSVLINYRIFSSQSRKKDNLFIVRFTTGATVEFLCAVYHGPVFHWSYNPREALSLPGRAARLIESQFREQGMQTRVVRRKKFDQYKRLLK